jgi:hypothetical protein
MPNYDVIVYQRPEQPGRERQTRRRREGARRHLRSENSPPRASSWPDIRCNAAVLNRATGATGGRP